MQTFSRTFSKTSKLIGNDNDLCKTTQNTKSLTHFEQFTFLNKSYEKPSHVWGCMSRLMGKVRVIEVMWHDYLWINKKQTFPLYTCTLFTHTSLIVLINCDSKSQLVTSFALYITPLLFSHLFAVHLSFAYLFSAPETILGGRVVMISSELHLKTAIWKMSGQVGNVLIGGSEHFPEMMHICQMWKKFNLDMEHL